MHSGAESVAGFELAVVLGVLLVFGLMLAFIIRSERKGRGTKLQISQSLGFTPMSEPPPELIRKINQLYQNIRGNRDEPEEVKYELQNVSHKRLADSEMFIFDLINTSGDDDSYTEVQAVAMISHHLSLPNCVIFPKADINGPLTNLGNQVLGWVVSKFGNPVEFPQFPEFEQRYLVSSPDPDGTRQFLDDSKLRRLAKTRLLGIHAREDMFTLSHINMSAMSLTRESMSERVNQAMDVFSIFSS